MICAGCQADLGRPERVGRRDTCPRCSVDLHACRQCRFPDPRGANGGRDPQADRVLDTSRANFCDYFSIAEAVAAAPTVAPGEATPTAAREALARLFSRR